MIYLALCIVFKLPPGVRYGKVMISFLSASSSFDSELDVGDLLVISVHPKDRHGLVKLIYCYFFCIFPFPPFQLKKRKGNLLLE